MEDLERYLNEVVDPTIADFEQNPTSTRHAFLACVATFHSVDYLAYPKKPRRLRQELTKQSPDFKEVDRIAHAFKHVTTGCESQNNKLKSSDIISRPPAFWEEMVWDLSRWDDHAGGVTINADRDADVLAIVKRARDFLWSKLTSMDRNPMSSTSIEA